MFLPIVTLSLFCFSEFSDGLFAEVFRFQDRSWYVDCEASPGGDGTTWETAWNDFGDIHWPAISPGDTIYLSGGKEEKVYKGSLVIDASGKPGNPIKITRGIEPNHSGIPVLDGEFGRENWYGVDLGWAADPPNNVVVSDLRVQHFASAGISVRSVEEGVVIENNEVICGSQTSDSPRGIDVRWSSNFIIRNNRITAPITTPAQTDGIYFQDNHRFVIDGNRVEISNLNGQGHSDALQLFENGSGVIRNNILVGPAAGDDNHTVVIEAQRNGTQLEVYNNVSIIRGDLFNFMIFRNQPDQSQGQINLYHNTFFNGARALSIENYQNAEICNNIIYSPTGQHLYVADGPHEENVSNNLIGTDPNFVSMDKLDLSLTSSSLAIDAGKPIPEIKRDINGIKRPQGKASDLGAYEFIKQ